MQVAQTARQAMVATRRREVHTVSKSLQLKKAVLMTVAVSTVAVPLFVSAAIKQDAERKSILYSADAGQVAGTPEGLYQRLKDQSRKICGSDDLILTGSIERVVGNRSCYEGTLNAAVERLDDPAVKNLHEREVSQL
jgi:UrcA family protein